MTCFIVNNYYHTREHALKHRPEKWFREWHFYPQTWYCDFENRLNEYEYLRYRHDDPDFIDNITKILSEQGTVLTILFKDFLFLFSWQLRCYLSE